MNHALSPAALVLSSSRPAGHDEVARLRRLRSLVSLFALYAFALLAVILLSDGADVGCILAGIAGHVLYATGGLVASWRDASILESARLRRFARATA